MSASMLLAAIAVPADREEPLLDFDAVRATVAEWPGAATGHRYTTPWEEA